MALRTVSTAIALHQQLPSTPPKQMPLDLEQIASEGLNIALSSMQAATASSNRLPTTPPKRKYNDLKPLGKGCANVVVQGKSLCMSPVALKVTTFFNAQHERRIMNQLFFNKTPHCLPCRDLCDPRTFQAKETSASPDAPAMLVTDLIPASDLYEGFLSSSVRMESRLKNDEIITIFISLLQYLKKLSSQKIIHRDLKPRNMIYHRPSRYLTVIDTGLAVDLTRLTEKQPSGQTPNYQAPECVLGNYLAPSIDLWSAGCILFEMLTDQQLIPFDYKTPRDQQNNHLLQMIAARIGKPSSEYLKSFDSAKKYFDRNLKEFIQPLTFNLKPWKEDFIAAVEQKRFSPSEIAAWEEILSKLLTYEKRTSAAELLEHSLFSQDICFHLSLSPDVVSVGVVRACRVPSKDNEELSALDFQKPDLFIPKRSLKHCYHIPQDPENQYFILVIDQKDNLTAHKIELTQDCLIEIKAENCEVREPYKKARNDLIQKLLEESTSSSVATEGSLAIIPSSLKGKSGEESFQKTQDDIESIE